MKPIRALVLPLVLLASSCAPAPPALSPASASASAESGAIVSLLETSTVKESA
jgi:hypothetical protein